MYKNDENKVKSRCGFSCIKLYDISLEVVLSITELEDIEFYVSKFFIGISTLYYFNLRVLLFNSLFPSGVSNLNH